MERVANSLCLITLQLETCLGGWPFHRIANAVEQLIFAATLRADAIDSGFVHLDQHVAGCFVGAGRVKGIEAVAS